MELSRFYFKGKSFLDSLNRKDAIFFKEHLSLESIPRGIELYKEDNLPKKVYIIKYGKIKIYQKNINGDSQIMYIYSTDEIFGFRPMLCNENNFTSAMTMEDSEIYTIEKKDFLFVVNKSINLALLLLRYSSQEFMVLKNLISASFQKEAKKRIALSLLIMEKKYEQSGILQTYIGISRSDLASFSGTTNETLARILSSFKDEKAIEVIGRKIVIKNQDALHQLAQ